MPLRAILRDIQIKPKATGKGGRAWWRETGTEGVESDGANDSTALQQEVI